MKDKIVVITGGAGLLGKEFCKSIIREGGVVIIADNNKLNGTNVEKEIKDEFNTNNIHFFLSDITNKQSIEKLINFTSESFGKIDALVNNAYPRNKSYGKDFLQVEYGDFCENINMHLGGYFLMSQQFSEFFLKQGRGNIINIASVYGVIAPRFDVYNSTNMTTPIEYAVIKSAIIHFTKYLAKYFKGKNIRVNSISPGGILDNQPENFIKAYNKYSLSKGMLDKEDILGTLLFLLSDMSKYINGQNLIIDDGFTL